MISDCSVTTIGTPKRDVPCLSPEGRLVGNNGGATQLIVGGITHQDRVLPGRSQRLDPLGRVDRIASD